jgi:hypothetical protein
MDDLIERNYIDKPDIGTKFPQTPCLQTDFIFSPSSQASARSFHAVTEHGPLAPHRGRLPAAYQTYSRYTDGMPMMRSPSVRPALAKQNMASFIQSLV